MGLDPTQNKRRHMPTKLQVEDRFDLGHGISFTWRQGGIVLAGLIVGYLVWKAVSVGLIWLGLFGLDVLPIVAAVLVILLFVAVALFKIQDRYLESWFAIWLTYRQFPKVYHWQPTGVPRMGRQATRGSASKKRQPTQEAASPDTDEEDLSA